MKISEKFYLDAEQRIDAAFKKARQSHKMAVKKYEDAKNTMESTKNTSQAEEAKAAYYAARDAVYPSADKAWMEYDKTVRDIRAELVTALEDADTYRAKDIDQEAITLLNAGTMRTKDYVQMAKDYAENPAVLAILRQKAKAAADSMGADQADDRSTLYNLVNDAKTEGEQFLEAFDAINSTAHTFAGRTPDGDFMSPDRIYNPTSLDIWEKYIVVEE